ncbi:SDR family NAD(P)-dependent oxidoreductase [Halobacillus trueperi]|uniref:SDR family NAD(P)-dependent oxidoreductase n=1 Tax=Halobacillus trueperi TaxID=156205 RepID=A0A3D8V9X0_9BACI|nr:SDR family oxidoreductase [Halobacillus trueperi]RDY66240.1 SDR family NAD(P)-dependent oxidoreductase [Halobacillus trueperi]
MTKKNETVLITGVAQGIGRGLAIAYAEKGYRVIGCDVNEEKGRETIKEVDGVFVRCDVSDPEEVEILFQKIKEPFSILINNAGVSEFKSIFELDVNEWDHVLNTNLRSCFLFSKYAAERWKKDKIPGRIVNMASTRAFMSEPDSEAYAASKGGLFALTHAMAASLSPYNIRVNSISPGWIHTGDPHELRDVDHDQHLSNRVGTVDDIAKACFYLTDEANDFVNGENVTVDGGMTRKMIYEH